MSILPTTILSNDDPEKTNDILPSRKHIFSTVFRVCEQGTFLLADVLLGYSGGYDIGVACLSLGINVSMRSQGF